MSLRVSQREEVPESLPSTRSPLAMTAFPSGTSSSSAKRARSPGWSSQGSQPRARME